MNLTVLFLVGAAIAVSSASSFADPPSATVIPSGARLVAAPRAGSNAPAPLSPSAIDALKAKLRAENADLIAGSTVGPTPNSPWSTPLTLTPSNLSDARTMTRAFLYNTPYVMGDDPGRAMARLFVWNPTSPQRTLLDRNDADRSGVQLDFYNLESKRVYLFDCSVYAPSYNNTFVVEPNETRSAAQNVIAVNGHLLWIVRTGANANDSIQRYSIALPGQCAQPQNRNLGCGGWEFYGCTITRQ